MGEALRVQDLPVDCLLKIQSFLIGKSIDLKFKHNKKFVELQRMFKINYTSYRFLSGERFGKRYIHSYYNIRMTRLNLNILLKQEDRLEKMWQETYNRFTQSGYCPYGYIFNSKIEIDIEGYSKEGFYVYLCSDELYIPDGGDVDVDAFLADTKMEFENEMIEKDVDITTNIEMTARIILEY